MIQAPRQPTPAASVGAAIPMTIVPRTRKIRILAGNDRQRHPEQAFPVQPLLLGDGGTHLGVDVAADRDVEDVKPRQHESRQEGPGVELADGGVVHHPVDDEHDARGDQDPQGAAGQDAAQGHQLVVLAVEHLGQGDHAHGHLGGPHDAGHGRHHRAGGDRRRGDAALEPAQPVVDHHVDVLDDPAPFEDVRHQDEQRDGVQQVVGHQAEDPGRDDVDGLRPLEDRREDDAHEPGGEGHRQAHEHDKHHAAEDEYGNPFNAHLNSLPVKAMWASRMVQTIPWRRSSTPPKGIRNLTG